MISAFVNSFKVPDLRARIFYTLAMIVIVRLGTAITLAVRDFSALRGRKRRDFINEDCDGSLPARHEPVYEEFAVEDLVLGRREVDREVPARASRAVDRPHRCFLTLRRKS